MKKDKVLRILEIYDKLQNGEYINKFEQACNYGVNERSIQRDIEDIREFLEKKSSKFGDINYVIYDRKEKGYYLEQVQLNKFTNEEVLAVCKILLSSRSLTQKEMYLILDKLVTSSVPYNRQKTIKNLISNEKFHYIEPKHKKLFLSTMWNIGQAIQAFKCIEVSYKRTKDKQVVVRHLQPLAIMFSEYYFYLTAFIVDNKVKERFDVMNDSFPTIYRIDRIKELKILDENFNIPYKDRFEEGEFLKRIQFMYGGKLQKLKFNYSGNDLDSILDRLPTATAEKFVLHDKDNIKETYEITAEVFGNGINMWLRSQGEWISDIKFR